MVGDLAVVVCLGLAAYIVWKVFNEDVRKKPRRKDRPDTYWHWWDEPTWKD